MIGADVFILVGSSVTNEQAFQMPNEKLEPRQPQFSKQNQQ
jgi:hypothetical protein